jgi:hypothetical protein
LCCVPCRPILERVHDWLSDVPGWICCGAWCWHRKRKLKCDDMHDMQSRAVQPCVNKSMCTLCARVYHRGRKWNRSGQLRRDYMHCVWCRTIL